MSRQFLQIKPRETNEAPAPRDKTKLLFCLQFCIDRIISYYYYWLLDVFLKMQRENLRAGALIFDKLPIFNMTVSFTKKLYFL